MKGNITKKIICFLVFFVGIVYGRSLAAQIPAQLISSTVYTVHRLSKNPSITFDAKTPYFEHLVIVDSNGLPCSSVLSNPNATNSPKVFNFSLVPNGLYYAKGFVTGAFIFYPINIVD